MKKILAFLMVPLFMLSLSACQEDIDITIAFEPNNGNGLTESNYREGSLFSMPPDPVKEDATFSGWYWDDGTFKEPFDVSGVLIQPTEGPYTVYAKWIELETDNSTPDESSEPESPEEPDNPEIPESETSTEPEDESSEPEAPESETSSESEDEMDDSDVSDEPDYTLSDPSRLQNIDMCRLQQTQTFDGDPPQSKGFPLRYNVVPTDGVVDIAIVALDFPDVQGDPELIDQWLTEIYTLETWSEFVAGDTMEYRVHFVPQWITTPREAKWYGCEGCYRVIQGSYDNEGEYRLQPEMDAIDEVLTATDDYYDWAEMEFAHFMFPPKAEAEPHYVRLYSHGGENYTPNAGQIFLPVFGGFMGWEAPEFIDFTVWDFVAHEVLHEQGLVGHGPYNGSMYSLMQYQHGYSEMVLSWEAFLLDWWDENHLACVAEESLDEPFTFEIDSLDQYGKTKKGPKNLMIPLNDEEIVVIEYRTDGPYSTLPEEIQGVMAYHINVHQPQFRCDRGCEDLSLEDYEANNFWRYLKDPNREHPCISDDPHPVYGNENGRFCDQPAFVHKPGAVLSVDDLTITVVDENVVTVERKHAE